MFHSRDGQSPVPMRIRALGSTEKHWISDRLDELADAGVDVNDATSLGSCFDRELAAFVDLCDSNCKIPLDTVVLIGVGLGEHLRRRVGLRWVWDTEQPEVFATVVQPLSGRIVLSPAHLIWRRWTLRDFGSIPKLIGQQHERLDAHQWLTRR